MENSVRSLYGLCRLCLVCLDGPEGYNIFGNNTIFHDILLHTNILQVAINDELPQTICSSCFQKIEAAKDLKHYATWNDIYMRSVRDKKGASGLKITRPKVILEFKDKVKPSPLHSRWEREGWLERTLAVPQRSQYNGVHHVEPSPLHTRWEREGWLERTPAVPQRSQYNGVHHVETAEPKIPARSVEDINSGEPSAVVTSSETRRKSTRVTTSGNTSTGDAVDKRDTSSENNITSQTRRKSTRVTTSANTSTGDAGDKRDTARPRISVRSLEDINSGRSPSKVISSEKNSPSQTRKRKIQSKSVTTSSKKSRGDKNNKRDTSKNRTSHRTKSKSVTTSGKKSRDDTNNKRDTLKNRSSQRITEAKTVTTSSQKSRDDKINKSDTSLKNKRTSQRNRSKSVTTPSNKSKDDRNNKPDTSSEKHSSQQKAKRSNSVPTTGKKSGHNTKNRCRACKKTFLTSKKLYLHKRSHDKNLCCSVGGCEKKFATKGDLLKHMRTHTGEKPYQCEICDKRFTQNATLKSHKEAIHKASIVV